MSRKTISPVPQSGWLGEDMSESVFVPVFLKEDFSALCWCKNRACLSVMFDFGE